MKPPNSTLYFNFHDLLGIQISVDRAEDASFCAAEYAFHCVQTLPAHLPQVHLRIEHREPASLPAGYTYHQHKLLARWGYQLKIEPDLIEINVIGNHLAVPMVHHMLLHPSLRYLGATRDVLLLHAGAIAHKEKSLIFTGSGGAGKTTITSLMLAGGGESWSPHADDYVFLAAGPESLAYVTRSHLYRDLLKWVPEIRSRLSPEERLQLELFGGLRRWSREQIKWPVRLPVERLWPGRSPQDRATPAALVILDRTEKDQHPNLHRIRTDEFPLEDLIAMNFYEARHFLYLVQKAGVFPDLDSWVQDWRSRERELLQKRYLEIPAYILEMPRQIDASREFQASLVDTLAGLVDSKQANVTIHP